MPDWVARGVDEFVRRFPADMPVSFTEIAAGKRGKNADIPRILQKEGEATLAAIPKGNRIVTLEVTGKPWDTPQLARQLDAWKMDGRDVSLLIGGPEGLAPECSAGHFLILHYPTLWCALLWRKAYIAPGLLPRTIRITGNSHGP